jgi:uncharacterized protein
VTNAIVDTSAIPAIVDEAYQEHLRIAEIIADRSVALVLSPLVVAEAEYMLYSRLGADAARRFASDIASEAYELAEWTAADHAAALEIMDQLGGPGDYIGVTNAANVVIADHYRTTDLLTLDQRQFRKLRPLWGAEYFTLLPYDHQ